MQVHNLRTGDEDDDDDDDDSDNDSVNSNSSIQYRSNVTFGPNYPAAGITPRYNKEGGRERERKEKETTHHTYTSIVARLLSRIPYVCRHQVFSDSDDNTSTGRPTSPIMLSNTNYNFRSMYGYTSTSYSGGGGYEEGRPSSGLVGLKNLGATCYLNSLIQVL